MSNNLVTLQLTKDQAQYVVNVLMTRPYGEVKDLLENIVQQANTQLIPPTPLKDEVPPKLDA